MEGKSLTILVSDTVLDGMAEMIKKSLPDYQGGLQFIFSDGSEADLKAKIPGADIILGARNKLPGSVLEKADKAFFLQQVSAGFDNIDLKVASQKGIKVSNAGGSGVIAVAEHTIMLMLAITKKLVFAHEKTLRGEWVFDQLMNKVGELREKTLGIIGLGRIAREVVRLAHAFHMKVQYSDIAQVDTSEFKDEVRFVSLEELLKTSDFISVHTNLTEKTQGMMNREAFSRMKPSAFLINTARGEIVETEALYEALKDGKIAGAALDVLPTAGAEISKIDHLDPVYEKLFKLDNVIITPHTAGATADNVRRTFEIAFKNAIKVINGHAPDHVVN
jgi:phosphoglycerate dehydrogenase-like enzyme